MSGRDPLSPTLAHDRSPPADRLARSMARWRRRSRVIRFWRLCLPVLMLAIAGGLLALVTYNVLYGPGRIADQNEEVRMLNPRFLGRDKGGRPYTVTAVDAVRNAQKAELVSLNRPHLVLENAAGAAPTVVDADFGLYNENTHILILDRNVRLDDGKLNIVESAHAVVDTDQGTVDGNTSVVATGPKGRTTGRAYKVRDRGADTEFIGDVRSHLLSQ